MTRRPRAAAHASQPYTPLAIEPSTAPIEHVPDAPKLQATEMDMSLGLIDEDPKNVRRQKPNEEADAALRASIARIGVIEPPTVVEHPDIEGRYMVVFGHRRIAACRALGHDAVRVLLSATRMEAVDIAAIQAAENMLRAPMHPVDRWRALERLLHEGMDERAAYAALGLGQRDGVLMRRLASIAEPILTELTAVPTERFEDVIPSLHVISVAAQNEQRSTLTAARKIVKDSPVQLIRVVANMLRKPVITADRAIFPISESKLPWVEDLFMQPNDPKRWSTPDVAGFVAEQTAALDTAISKERALGHPIQRAPYDDQRQNIALPPGWDMSYRPAEKPLPKGSTSCIFACVRTSGHGVGQVLRVIGDPRAPRQSPLPERSDAEPAREGSRGPVTHKGQEAIACGQEIAIQNAIASIEDPITLLGAMVIALGGRNIRIEGSPHNHEQKFNGWYENSVADLSYVTAMVPSRSPGENYEQFIMAQARAAIARMVVAPSPRRGTSSGDSALFLGHWIGAQDHLPRFDSLEFLKEVNGDTLVPLAKAAGKQTSKVGAMRSALAGTLEGWRPPGSEFRSPTQMEVDAIVHAKRHNAMDIEEDGTEEEGDAGDGSVFGKSGE